MNKTTVRTFIAAAFLLVMSVISSLYGQSIVESQRTAEGLSPYWISECGGRELTPWERAAGLMLLMSFSVTIAGAIFWYREPRPMAEQASILRLEDGVSRPMVRVVAPSQSAVIKRTLVDETHRHLHEEESLTPLERVIRGY